MHAFLLRFIQDAKHRDGFDIPPTYQRDFLYVLLMTPRKRTLVALLVLGATAVAGGVLIALVTTSSTEQASSGSMPTLPVHVYVQYTQRLLAPDYTGLAIGITVAAVGALLLLAGALLTLIRARTA